MRPNRSGTTLIVAACGVLLLSQGPGPWPVAQADQAPVEVSADFARPLPGTPSMVGMLHGFGGVNAVKDDQVRQIKPRLFRGSLAQALLMEGTVSGKQALVNEMGGRYMFMASDLWGYPVKKYECGACPVAPHPSADWVKWETFIRDKADRAKTKGYTNLIYEVWNTPDDPGYGLDTESEHHETYLRAERIIHDVLPAAPVAGPSLASFDRERIRRFLDFCLARGCQVNTLTWHELLDDPRNPDPARLPPDIPEVADHLRYARQEFVKNPKYAPLNINEIMVDEHTGLADAYRPGESLGYLAAMEQGGASASARWCWDLYNPEQYECFNGSLGGLLKANQPRAVWWVYRAYNAGVTTRVASASSDPAVAVLASSEGFAAAAAQVVVGHLRLQRRANPPPVELQVELDGLDVLPLFAGAGSVAVSVLRLPDTGRIAYLQPALMKSVEVPILGGRARFDAGSLPLHEAYVLQLRRGSLAPVTITPAPVATSTPPPTVTATEAPRPATPTASPVPTTDLRPTPLPTVVPAQGIFLPVAANQWPLAHP